MSWLKNTQNHICYINMDCTHTFIMCVSMYVCQYLCMYDVHHDIQIPCTCYVGNNLNSNIAQTLAIAAAVKFSLSMYGWILAMVGSGMFSLSYLKSPSRNFCGSWSSPFPGSQ